METERNKSLIAVGMSGGVDSSVSALLLKRAALRLCSGSASYDVVGLFMKLWHDPCGTGQNACCDEKALADARKVAKKIGIPLYVVDARKEFKSAVTDYFIDEYKNVRTPNPCVVCNKKIKFGWLLDFAKKIGCDKLATGHYCRIKEPVIPAKAGIQKRGVDPRVKPEDDNPSYRLLKGVDESKDQSYFLYQLDQNQLSHVIFPVGGMTKAEVRKTAKEAGLPVHEKKESQEICFVEDDYRDFLRRNLGADAFKPGEIVDAKGNVIGRHDGLINYTIGQRKGIEQSTLACHPELDSGSRTLDSGSRVTVRNDRVPLYVVGFDVKKNRLIAGRDEELYKSEFEVENLNFIPPLDLPALTPPGLPSGRGGALAKGEKIGVKIRYQAEEIPCILCPSSPSEKSANLISSRRASNNKMRVVLERPARAITPGQSAVFYLGDEVLGGGMISS